MVTSSTTPVEFRHLVRQGRFTGPTSGVCPGYTQANLVIVPQAYAYDFLLLAQRNPRPCPILEVSDVGSRQLQEFAQDVDLATDFPRYRVYQNGKLVAEPTAVDDYWQNDFVAFLIGCSFSFEAELVATGCGIPAWESTFRCTIPIYHCVPPGACRGRWSWACDQCQLTKLPRRCK